MNNTVVQIIGFIGMAFMIASYQIKSNKKLFTFQLIGSIIFTVQFFLLGAYTGALTLIVNILRNLFLLNVNRWPWVKSKITLSALLVILVAVTAMTWVGPLSLLPLASIGITTIGYWSNNAQKIRGSQLMGSPCTLVYDVIVRSWAGAMNESIVIISILISIFRFGWKNMGENGDF